MNTQRDWLDTFFSRMPVTVMIQQTKQFSKNGYLSERFCTRIDKLFNQHLQSVFSTSSKDEREEIYYWGMDLAFRDLQQQGKNSKLKGPFKHLRDFAREVLTEIDEKPHCKFDSVLRWRMLTQRIDPDAIICAFLAEKDFCRGVKRLHFTWEPIIKTDNLRLHRMLDKGMAENHFHLFGSGPHFQLNWLSLMNRPTGRMKDFKISGIVQNHLDPKHFASDYEIQSSDSMETLIKKAALIRLYLFESTKGIKPTIEKSKLFKLLMMSDKELLPKYQEYVERIQMYRYKYGYEFIGKAKGKPDYCLDKSLAQENWHHNLFLTSERKLIYDCYYKIYEDYHCDNTNTIESLFYLYLLMKSNFRAEMIQVNERHGFMNFSEYQDRKDGFIESEPLFMEALTYMAVAGSYTDQNIISLEARITPKKSHAALNESINFIDDVVAYNDEQFKSKAETNRYRHFIEGLKQGKKENKKETPLFFVIHMPKGKDKSFWSSLNHQDRLRKCLPRNYEVRLKNKRTFNQIEKVRLYRASSAYRIYGIDACSNEIGCRPEVFAHAIRATRYLNGLQSKTLGIQAKALPTIRVTYHAGEDFLDPVDGMRAIDEAIIFNQMTHGDRIGHALALGIDVEEWYACKRFTMVMPKQDYIDNLAWMIQKIIDYKIPVEFSTIRSLQNEFNFYFNEVYPTEDGVTETVYIRSWQLRGDSPDLYKRGSFERSFLINHWNNHSILDKNSLNSIRHESQAARLYYLYHFDAETRNKGNMRCNIVISKDYMVLANKIQKSMQFFLRQIGIGIECNPSSNYLIGSFKRYDRHPLVQFYNLGLTDHVSKNPQLFVSINTDDQGVFGTYLENEYALMALALQKCKDVDGYPLYNPEMIYNWLDRIRLMGIEQSFRVINK